MRRSLRWRIQVWYAGLFAFALIVFCLVVYWRVERVEFQRADAELEGAANSLVSVLRGIPRHELEPWMGFSPPEPRRPPLREPWPGQGGEPPLPESGMRRWQQALQLPPGFVDRNRRQRHYFFVWQGREVLARSPNAPELARLMVPEVFEGMGPEHFSEGQMRFVVQQGPINTIVLVAKSIERELSDLRRWMLTLGGVSLGVFFVALAGGAWLSRRALRPLAVMSDTAASISADDLTKRIDTSTTDLELLHLAGTLNSMFDRLESAFERQAAFTADASHELRTPLTILLTQLELIRKSESGSNQSGLLVCERAARRMKGLIEQLLLLARADAGTLPVQPQTFDLAEITDECMDLLQPLAEQQKVELQRDLASAEVNGDPQLLSQVIINLITNAIQYNRPGGHVKVELTSEPKTVRLVVRDSGCGIPSDIQSKVFQRFFRADNSRSRDTGGNGLGLAISRSIVVAHAGVLTFQSTPEQGSVFVCDLPNGT